MHQVMLVQSRTSHSAELVKRCGLRTSSNKSFPQISVRSMGWTIHILPSHASTKTSRTWKFKAFYSNAWSKYYWKWKPTWSPETSLHYQYWLMWALDIRMSCQNQDLERKETWPKKIRHDIIKSGLPPSSQAISSLRWILHITIVCSLHRWGCRSQSRRCNSRSWDLLRNLNIQPGQLLQLKVQHPDSLWKPKSIM